MNIRSVQQPGLGHRTVPRPLLFNLDHYQLVLNTAVCLKSAQHGKAEPQRDKVGLVGVFFSFLSICVIGEGIEMAAQSIFESFERA